MILINILLLFISILYNNFITDIHRINFGEIQLIIGIKN